MEKPWKVSLIRRTRDYWYQWRVECVNLEPGESFLWCVREIGDSRYDLSQARLIDDR